MTRTYSSREAVTAMGRQLCKDLETINTSTEKGLQQLINNLAKAKPRMAEYLIRYIADTESSIYYEEITRTAILAGGNQRLAEIALSNVSSEEQSLMQTYINLSNLIMGMPNYKYGQGVDFKSLGYTSKGKMLMDLVSRIGGNFSYLTGKTRELVEAQGTSVAYYKGNKAVKRAFSEKMNGVSGKLVSVEIKTQTEIPEEQPVTISNTNGGT